MFMCCLSVCLCVCECVYVCMHDIVCVCVRVCVCVSYTSQFTQNTSLSGLPWTPSSIFFLKASSGSSSSSSSSQFRQPCLATSKIVWSAKKNATPRCTKSTNTNTYIHVLLVVHTVCDGVRHYLSCVSTQFNVHLYM